MEFRRVLFRSVNSATSWRPTNNSLDLRDTVSSVEASITFSIDSMPHSASWVASLSLYVCPLANGCLPSQKSRALKLESSKGGALSSAATEPRATKICSVKVMPTDSPAEAVSLEGAFHRSIVFTVLVLLVGEKTSTEKTIERWNA